MDFFSYDILLSLFTLTILEIILGIDNLIFITLVVQDLPEKYRKISRTIGLSLALIIRILMLMTLSWVMSLTEPVVSFNESYSISYRDVLLIVGGLFLIIKSGKEIFEDAFVVEEENTEEKKISVKGGMIGGILQIAAIDFVFSFDSVITAIGMTNNIPVIVIAVVISMIVMLLSSEKIGYFLKTYPSLKIIALAFILMIGVILLADGFHLHVSKVYLYFALFFTIAVESLNIASRRKNHND